MKRPIKRSSLQLQIVALLSMALCLAGCGPIGRLLPWEDEPDAAVEAQPPDEGASTASTEETDDTGSSVSSAFAHGLWYESLGDTERQMYDKLLPGLLELQKNIDLGFCTPDELDAAFWAVMADHPEVFWVDSYTYYSAAGLMRVEPNLTDDVDDLRALSAQVQQAADEVLADLPADASDYAKLRHCYEWIVLNTDYVSSPHDQTVQGVLLNHNAVCGGYAKALQYLLQRVGVRCDLVLGTATERGSHAWNIAWLDGTPTYVDVTWGDPTFIGEDGSVFPGESLLYDYLCVTSEELGRDHVAEEPSGALPACDSTDYDYYRLAGTYMEYFDTSELYALVSDADAEGRSSIRIKLGSRDAYDTAAAYVLSQEAFDILPAYASHLEISWQENLYIIGLEWS